MQSPDVKLNWWDYDFPKKILVKYQILQSAYKKYYKMYWGGGYSLNIWTYDNFQNNLVSKFIPFGLDSFGGYGTMVPDRNSALVFNLSLE